MTIWVRVSAMYIYLASIDLYGGGWNTLKSWPEVPFKSWIVCAQNGRTKFANVPEIVAILAKDGNYNNEKKASAQRVNKDWIAWYNRYGNQIMNMHKMIEKKIICTFMCIKVLLYFTFLQTWTFGTVNEMNVIFSNLVGFAIQKTCPLHL